MNNISIAIPYHGDRFRWTMKTITNCHKLANVTEIVITIEPLDVSSLKLERECRIYPKVRIFKNDKKLFVFRNKVNAVQRCTNEWVALIDSDNIINSAYLGAFLNSDKNPNIIYQPSIGQPRLNFEEYIGKDIGLRYAAEQISTSLFNMLFNNMNYIIHRKTWLNALEGAIQSDYEPLTADSAYINYYCLKAGMVMRVIKGMVYIHTIHNSSAPDNQKSTYMLHQEEGVREYSKIINNLKEYLYPGVKGNVSGSLNWSAVKESSRNPVEYKGDSSQLLTD